MPAQTGKEFLLQVDDGAGGYTTVGGFTSNSFTINGNPVDITNKDSNGFRESLSGGANIAIETSGNGVFMGGPEFDSVHAAVMAGTHLDAKVTIPGMMTYTGPFIVSSLGFTGDTEGAVNYDISLQSAGQITAQSLLG